MLEDEIILSMQSHNTVPNCSGMRNLSSHNYSSHSSHSSHGSTALCAKDTRGSGELVGTDI